MNKHYCDHPDCIGSKNAAEALEYILQHRDRVGQHPCPGSACVICTEGWGIANITSAAESTDSVSLNSERIRQAAPELLEALIALTKAIENEDGDPLPIGQARRAIAKAEGSGNE